MSKNSRLSDDFICRLASAFNELAVRVVKLERFPNSTVALVRFCDYQGMSVASEKIRRAFPFGERGITWSIGDRRTLKPREYRALGLDTHSDHYDKILGVEFSTDEQVAERQLEKVENAMSLDI